MAEYKDIAIGEIGTQLFWFNPTSSKFEYAVPVTAGAEFGGDAESFDAPETDLDYVPKVGGRNQINDIAYTSNYTKEKFKRIEEITDIDDAYTYMEVLSDGSAFIFIGTSGGPQKTNGDVPQINFTIVPSFKMWVYDIYALTSTETGKMESNWYTGTKLNIDIASIPTARKYYAVEHNTDE